MHPILFKVGSIEIRSFSIMMMIAVISALIIASKRAPSRGVKVTQLHDAALWMVVFGILGARIAYIVQYIPYYRAHINELLSLRFEGLTSFGGIIGGGLVLLYYAKIKKLNVIAFLDTLSVPFLIAHAIGRVGCFLNGCCFGFACAASPPGVHFAGTEGLHMPAQLFDSAMVVLGAGGLLLLEKRGLKPGASFGWMMVIYGLSRFIDEFWRMHGSSEPLGPLPISLAQIFAMAMMIGGGVLIRSNFKRAQDPVPA